MSDLIDRQEAIDAILGEPPEAHYPSWYAEIIQNLPSAQPDIKAAYEQGRIQGHVEMRTELLMQLKEIVGDEVWKNI